MAYKIYQKLNDNNDTKELKIKVDVEQQLSQEEKEFVESEFAKSSNVLNLVDIEATTESGITYSLNNDIVTIIGTKTTEGTFLKSLGYCACEPDTQYIAKVYDNPDINVAYLSLAILDASKNLIDTKFPLPSIAFTTPSNAAFFELRMGVEASGEVEKQLPIVVKKGTELLEEFSQYYGEIVHEKAFNEAINEVNESIKSITGGGVVSGVKGSAETNYRVGNVNITAENIGLGNVDNTSDLNKPISNATQTALNNKANTNAPTNVSGTETTTAKFKTSNGGAIILGKEGSNSGTMIRLDQVDGTARLRFRASSTAGAMVWEQPEQGAQLYIDLGKEGSDKHRVSFPSSAGTLALTSQIPSVGNGTLTIQRNGTSVGTFTANQSNASTVNITVPTGDAANKGVVTSIDTSTNLPTSNAVKTFVEGKGYALSSEVPTFVTLTQSEYDALTTKDSNTYYFIKEE